MTLSKETLNKTAAILEAEILEIENEEKEIHSKIKSICFKNFKVNCIEKDWYDRGENKNFEITFKHNNVNDVDFRINTNKTFDRISWSSWSYSRMKKEEQIEAIKKSKAYIEAVHEMLCILEDIENTELENVMKQASEIYVNDLQPLKTKRYELEKEVKNIKEATSEIEKEEVFEKAIEFFKEKKYLVNGYSINNRNTIYEIQILQDKKGNYKIEMFGRSKKLCREDIIDMYKLATKINATYDWSGENGSKVFYKNNNSFPTREEAYTPVRTIITEEEYNELRKIG
jgi:hypothetical protein